MNKNVELEHTQTPWFTGIRREDDNTIPIIDREIDKGYMPICLVCPAPFYKDNQDKNASFIVRAVNAYDDLVAALRGLEGIAHEIHMNKDNTMNLQVMAGAGLYARIEAAWAALRKAEGK